jgi:Protein of unknown function (DUF2855)
MSDFLVKRDDLRQCRVVEADPPPLEDGQALLRVDSFGLTANNVTYGVMGESMRYWDFFPAGEGWGRVPMWGFADVAESTADGLEPGRRVYGYLPPSTHLVVTPKRANERGFVDGSPHRARLPSAYNRYLLTGTDPFYRPESEDHQMIFRPLFFTSFLLDDELGDGGLAGAVTAVLSSASAKTTIGTAFLLARREGVDVIGLTSPGNVEFVDALGVYDRVVPYSELDSLEREPVAYVDVAGDAQLRAAVHRHFGDRLTASIAVGAARWENLGDDPGGLPGPRPRLFFAPDRVTKRSEDWGRDELERRVAAVAVPFLEWTAGWLEVIRDEGMEGVQRAYLAVLEGEVPPSQAHVLAL